MRLWRFEVGVWTTARKLTLKDYFEFSYDPGMCGCKILTISRMYFTILGDECYFNPPENEAE